MLKFLFKISLPILILFGLGSYTNYLLTGKIPDIVTNKPILADIKMPELTSTLSDKFSILKEKEPVANTYLYKWRDTKGVIHYTNEKPPENIQNFESIKLSNDTNIVPTVSDNEAARKKPAQQQAPSTNLPTNIYSPKGIKHLFEQAKDVQNLMNNQFTQQENSINGD
jgi:uncharacterized protein DUF4124